MVKYLECRTNNSNQTKKMAEALARETLRTNPRKTAFLLALEGDLGSGKTTFLQGFARGLGIREKILSPTFIIFRKFKVPRNRTPKDSDVTSEPPGQVNSFRGRQNSKFKIFYHLDCYRLQKPKEILKLDFKEIISNPQNIVAVEWSEKIKKVLPKNKITLKFEFIDPVRDSKDKKKRRRKQISNGVDRNKRKISIKWPNN